MGIPGASAHLSPGNAHGPRRPLSAVARPRPHRPRRLRRGGHGPRRPRDDGQHPLGLGRAGQGAPPAGLQLLQAERRWAGRPPRDLLRATSVPSGAPGQDFTYRMVGAPCPASGQRPAPVPPPIAPASGTPPPWPCRARLRSGPSRLPAPGPATPTPNPTGADAPRPPFSTASSRNTSRPTWPWPTRPIPWATAFRVSWRTSSEATSSVGSWPTGSHGPAALVVGRSSSLRSHAAVGGAVPLAEPAAWLRPPPTWWTTSSPTSRCASSSSPSPNA